MATVTGTASNDTIYARDGAGDLLQALGGDDWLVGASGADTLEGGSGQDSLVGAGGDDVLRGGFGPDRLSGGNWGYNDPSYGSNQIYGEGGDDWLEGGLGDDTMDGGAENDSVNSYGGKDWVLGGQGDDSLLASLGAARVDGGDGRDYAWINPLPAGETRLLEVVTGGAGNDAMGSASLHGLRFVFDGGAGIDTLQLDNLTGPLRPERYQVYLNQEHDGAVIIGRDVERLELRTDAGDVYGSDGVETITGSNQADLIYAGGGSDLIRGDFTYSDYAWDQIPEYAEGGNDTVWGGAGDDTLTEVAGRNYVRGEQGNDVLRGGREFDDLHGNEGNDTLNGGGGDDWVVGGKDNDRLSGDLGGDIVYGNLGDDTLDGGAGADIVRGGQASDLVRGGDGDDWISGDLGFDTLTGGAGADVFHIFGAAGIDLATDFNAAEGDRVQLLPGEGYRVHQNGADTLVMVDGGGQLTLTGVQAASLPPGWIFSG